MKVYYDSLQGPQCCKVIREIDAEYVELEPTRIAGGPFGGFPPMMRRFVTYKSFCWNHARSLNKYGTRHELSGRPAWGITP